MSSSELAQGDDKNKKNAELLQELEALSSTLYQSHTRRTASLALPRDSVVAAAAAATITPTSSSRARPRRMSLSPWRSRPKEETPVEKKKAAPVVVAAAVEESSGGGKWKKWKAIRALSHIGMQKLSCLFSVEVVAIHDLPASMNGLRLSVCVRKKETRDGSVHTMPSRVTQGAADFEETLFLRCHLYCSSSNSNNFDPRPFWVYAFAVDAPDLDFGRSPVDLASLVRNSVQRSQQGERVRTWDLSFPLSGKAKGANLLLKVGFQIMDKDGGLSIYNTSTANTTATATSSVARKQSKSSFSVPSPKLTSRTDSNWTPLHSGISAADEIDHFNLDDPKPLPPAVVATEQQDLDNLPDFEIEDKGVEFQEEEHNDDTKVVEEKEEEEEEEEDEEVKSIGEKSVVKEIDSVHVARLTELDSIAQQIKALESSMTIDTDDSAKISKESKHKSQRLEADEESVTREFLQMLEDEEFSLGGGDTEMLRNNNNNNTDDEYDKDNSQDEHSNTYLPDLGRNLGCVVQTRDGGYLAAMNPSDTETPRKETPKLAMQVSRPFVMVPETGENGLEVLQGMKEEVMRCVETMDDVSGKTAEQIAFEGIAAAVINGRKRAEVASSSAGRAIASAKAAAASMMWGRRERVATGIWNVREEAVAAGELVVVAMPRIEAMAAEALKIQADLADEDAPFEISNSTNTNKIRDAMPMEDWMDDHQKMKETLKRVTVVVGVQVRDPLRRLEPVGGPMVAVIIADRGDDDDEEEMRWKVRSVDVGGVKGKSKIAEKHRLTAMHWLVAAARSAKNVNNVTASAKKGSHDHVLWSLSSRVMADMWLSTIRNPDVNLIAS